MMYREKTSSKCAPKALALCAEEMKFNGGTAKEVVESVTKAMGCFETTPATFRNSKIL
jgi:hypothetical protein